MSEAEREILSHAMSLLARRSGQKLTKAQRKERARKAARARWAKRRPAE